MHKANKEEIESSILMLKEYENRLISEINHMAKKLKIPKEQIEVSLKNHEELNKIKQIIARLIKEKMD